MQEDNTFESLLESLSAVIETLNSDKTNEMKETHNEIILPPQESLLVQFAGRQVYSAADAMNDRLTSSYWLTLPTTDETDGDVDNVCIVAFHIIPIFFIYYYFLFSDSL